MSVGHSSGPSSLCLCRMRMIGGRSARACLPCLAARGCVLARVWYECRGQCAGTINMLVALFSLSHPVLYRVYGASILFLLLLLQVCLRLSKQGFKVCPGHEQYKAMLMFWTSASESVETERYVERITGRHGDRSRSIS